MASNKKRGSVSETSLNIIKLEYLFSRLSVLLLLLPPKQITHSLLDVLLSLLFVSFSCLSSCVRVLFGLRHFALHTAII